jgi:hypothetical protein
MKTPKVLGVLLALGLCQCNRSPHEPADEKAQLVELTERQTPPSSRVSVRGKLVYQIGITTWEGGQSTLTIAPDGKTGVKNVMEGREPRTYAGRIERDEVAKIHSLIAAGDLWKMTRRSTATPGEAQIEIALEEQGKTVRKVALWGGQLEEQPALMELKALLDKSIQTISHGEVY